MNSKETDINSELSRKHFNYQTPSNMLEDLYTTNDRK